MEYIVENDRLFRITDDGKKQKLGFVTDNGRGDAIAGCISPIKENWINAKINYVEVSADYNEFKENHEKRIMVILEQMEEGAELYGDITFGPRTVPMEMLCAFAFADSFVSSFFRGSGSLAR